MTPANIAEMMLPLLTQLSVEGMMEPVMEEPRTKSGKREVSCDRISSIFDVEEEVLISSWSLLLLLADRSSVFVLRRIFFDVQCIIVG